MIDLHGMKVISAKEMARIEKLSYESGSNEEDFMQTAGEKVAEITEDFCFAHALERHVILLIGKGNNGGDAYVAGTALLKQGFAVEALHIFPFDSCSPLCRLHCDRFRKEGGKVQFLTSENQIKFPEKALIIDGLLGTGFKGKLEGLLLKVIQKANSTKLPTIAIDIPSGVDGSTGEVQTEAIRADVTVFLGLPKVGFFIGAGWNYVGELLYADFGLPKKFTEQAEEVFALVDERNLRNALPVIQRNRHKYQAGYVVGIAGSKGMSGAAKLSGLSALRSGAGIVRLLCSKEMYDEMQNAPYELLKEQWSEQNIEKTLEICNKAKAIFVGPGLGREKKIADFLSKLLPKVEVACVMDADALFFFAEHHSCKLPKKIIMTPHHKEMLRMLNLEDADDELDFLHRCQLFCEEYNITLLLKGGPSFIFEPKKKPLIVPRGDPGMASAGTGDVLTGVIAALLAQGLDTYTAAILGAYLHALAGEAAAEKKTSYSLIASDLIKHLPDAYKTIMNIS